MDKYLKPARFGCDPNASGADKQFKHWLRTFQIFIKTINTATPTSTTATTETTDGDTAIATTTPADDLKLTTLTSYVQENVFEYTQYCNSYDKAIETLTKIYVKPVKFMRATSCQPVSKQREKLLTRSTKICKGLARIATSKRFLLKNVE